MDLVFRISRNGTSVLCQTELGGKVLSMQVLNAMPGQTSQLVVSSAEQVTVDGTGVRMSLYLDVRMPEDLESVASERLKEP